MKSPKPVLLRALVLADVDEAIAYYPQEAGVDVALGSSTRWSRPTNTSFANPPAAPRATRTS